MKFSNADDARRKVLLYGDMNLNVLDGSAVWLASMAEVLSNTNSLVDLLLKHEITNERLINRLLENPRIRIIEPSDDGQPNPLSPRVAAQRILGLDSKRDYDVVIARGLRVSQYIVNSDRLAEKSWLYVTDVPFPSWTVTDQAREVLTRIASRSKRMFAQTEDSRAYLESLIPESAGKCILLPPMVPDDFYTNNTDAAVSDGSLKLVYAGKFAKRWRTLEMCGLKDKLAESGVEAEVKFIGDKFQDDVKDPEWPARMAQEIQKGKVEWLGGLSRQDTLHEVRQADIGLGWRDASMDASLEISTKALEYAASGVCPLLNRTAAHERLFGQDYPLFVDSDDINSVVAVLVDAARVIPEMRERVRRAASHYSMSAASNRLEEAFVRGGSEVTQFSHPTTGRPLRVVLAGHDFKFAGELVDRLMGDPSIELRIDEWATLHKHDISRSRSLLEWADTVICEWAGPNAAWYSNNKRQDQSLVVRLHAFELRGPWLKNIKVDALDKVVCVSDLYRNLTHSKTAWPLEKIVVIPNAIDVIDFIRPKQAGSEFRLGLVGIVPYLKRPDRAVDVLEKLLERDDRFTLHIKGRMPWEYPHEWRKPLQQQAYLEFFSRIGQNPTLMKHIVFEPFGADMANWLTKIGWVLSPSTRESFHMAPAEGMASGAVPIVWQREGAEEIFGPHFMVEDSSGAAKVVIDALRDRNHYSQAVQMAEERARLFDSLQTWRAWKELLSGGIARSWMPAHLVSSIP